MEVNQPKSGYHNNIIYNVIWIKRDSRFKIKIDIRYVHQMSYKSCLKSKHFKLQKFTSIKLAFLGCKYVGSFSLECDWLARNWNIKDEREEQYL